MVQDKAVLTVADQYEIVYISQMVPFSVTLNDPTHIF